MPEKPGSSPQNPVTVDQLLKDANVPVVSSAPVNASKPPESIPQGAVLRDKSGRMMYRYEVDGNIVLLPKPVEQMKEQDYYDLPITLYDNQPGRIPQNLAVVFKDPQWAGHWFNKRAKEGLRVAEARSLGFQPAKKEDLDKYYLELNDKDGAIEQGDLVLMKTSKVNLYMRYKQSMDKALQAGGVSGYKNKANEMLNPANRAQEPFYVAEQAKKEFQGAGPLFNIDQAGVLNANR
jgi:hypothetical protein